MGFNEDDTVNIISHNTFLVIVHPRTKQLIHWGTGPGASRYPGYTMLPLLLDIKHNLGPAYFTMTIDMKS